MSNIANQETWTRLETRLGAMRAGDVITLDRIVAETGMGAESAELVLDSLVRADLFERHGEQFMRISLLGDAELQRAPLR
jgi:hypothetical protein